MLKWDLQVFAVQQSGWEAKSRFHLSFSPKVGEEKRFTRIASQVFSLSPKT